jgi:hypothetical protein
MRRSPRVSRSESDEQIAIFQWAEAMKAQYPELGLLHAIPNGGFRSWATARRLKKEGVKPGVPDICLPVPRNGHHGLYLELKREGGRATPEQRAWLQALNELGYCTALCVGAEAAIEKIMGYLG